MFAWKRVVRTATTVHALLQCQCLPERGDLCRAGARANENTRGGDPNRIKLCREWNGEVGNDLKQE